jgi:hypothetical protein
MFGLKSSFRTSSLAKLKNSSKSFARKGFSDRLNACRI